MTTFIYAAVPDDPRYLVALGSVVVRHGHLEYHLRMMVKTVGRMTVDEALLVTVSQSVAGVRERIEKLAHAAFGEGPTLEQLKSLIARCRVASDARNDLLHNMYARELDGELLMRGKDLTFRTIPPAAHVEALAAELKSLVIELNTARLEGFIRDAMLEAKR